MPSLNWIGKDAVVKHHKDVPFRLLEPVPELSVGDVGSRPFTVAKTDGADDPPSAQSRTADRTRRHRAWR